MSRPKGYTYTLEQGPFTYSSVSDALADIPLEMRDVGRTVVVVIDDVATEYWWQTGVTDSDLVEKLSGGGSVGDGYYIVNDKTSAYTLQASDNGKYLTFNSTNEIILSIPVGLSAGFHVKCVQLGLGKIKIEGISTVISNVNDYTRSFGQYAVIDIISHLSNQFVITGDMGPADVSLTDVNGDFYTV